MKQIRNHLVSLLVIPALIAFATPGSEIAFEPEEGYILAKTYENTSEMTLDDMSVVMNGQEQDPSMMAMEQTITNKTKYVISDEYVAVSGGRPAKLKRTYDTLESGMSMAMSHPMMGDMDMEMSGASELEGKTVIFTWNEEDGEYTLAFDDDSGGNDELLEGLTEDTDLRGFLPGREVSEGDTWTIEPQVLRGILAFGGSLKIEYEDSEMEEQMMGLGSGPSPSPDEFLGEIEGTVTGEFVDVREEDGVRVAAIKVVCEVTSAKDMTDLFAEAMEEQELPEGMEMERAVESVDMEYEFEGEGLLLWNLGAGHVHSFELTGDGSTTIDMAMSMSMQGMDMDMELSMVMTGDDTITIATSAGGE